MRPRCAIAFQQPGIALFHNVLTPTECNYLIEHAQSRLQRSTVLTSEEGKYETVNAGRTSSGAYLARGETPEVSLIEQRLAALTNSPYENGEGLQVLRYEEGQCYLPHHDYFDEGVEGYAKYLERGGQRVFTVLLYLNDSFSEGETEFPLLRFVVPPIKGSALVFRNLSEDGKQLDTQTLHGGRPPKGGTKYVATKWIRQGPF